MTLLPKHLAISANLMTAYRFSDSSFHSRYTIPGCTDSSPTAPGWCLKTRLRAATGGAWGGAVGRGRGTNTPTSSPVNSSRDFPVIMRRAIDHGDKGSLV
jgi:hypothetical protein